MHYGVHFASSCSSASFRTSWCVFCVKVSPDMRRHSQERNRVCCVSLSKDCIPFENQWSVQFCLVFVSSKFGVVSAMALKVMTSVFCLYTGETPCRQLLTTSGCLFFFLCAFLWVCRLDDHFLFLTAVQ